MKLAHSSLPTQLNQLSGCSSSSLSFFFFLPSFLTRSQCPDTLGIGWERRENLTENTKVFLVRTSFVCWHDAMSNQSPNPCPCLIVSDLFLHESALLAEKGKSGHCMKSHFLFFCHNQKQNKTNNQITNQSTTSSCQQSERWRRKPCKDQVSLEKKEEEEEEEEEEGKPLPHSH